MQEILTSHGVRLGNIETNYLAIEQGYKDFYTWTQNVHQPFYNDYQSLKERYITRFGGDDEDLNNDPGQGSGYGGGDDDDDAMEPEF